MSPAQPSMAPNVPAPAACSVRLEARDGPPDAALCARARAQGATALMLPAPWIGASGAAASAPADADTALLEGAPAPIAQWFAAAARAASAHGLALMVELRLDRVARQAVAATRGPGWYQPRAEFPARDPRLPAEDLDMLALRQGPAPPDFVQAWAERLAGWTAHGVAGFLFHAPDSLEPAQWLALNTALRNAREDVALLAWTPGLPAPAATALREARFDGLVSSLPWWDYKSSWFADEDARLRGAAAVIAALSPAQQADARAVWCAALAGDALLLEEGGEPSEELAGARRWMEQARLRGPLHMLGGRDGRATVLLRASRNGGAAALAVNPRGADAAAIDWDAIAPLLPAGRVSRDDAPPHRRLRDDRLPPGGCALFMLAPAEPVHEPGPRARPRTEGGAAARIVIEQVTPSVDGGAFAVKCIAHERVTVQADIYMDGHDRIAAELRWRAVDETRWRAEPMRHESNDRWEASFRPHRVGPHEFAVCAWLDAWESFRHELEVKHRAGADVGLEVQEGLALLRAALARAGDLNDDDARRRLAETLAMFEDDAAHSAESRIPALLEEGLAQAMRVAAERSFETESPVPFPLWVDRREAGFASWYELFPRSQAREPGRHGTFDDVIARLPDIRDMGFDVLYMPPIHPIGERNRKGRNNSLRAEPGDLGSPYAIGSANGGHDAIEPALGTLDDFLRLVDAAAAHGMELALDYAIQCSPDHPWLAQHPDWFSWRPDGSLRYAENPPKKYEDIVNVAFYGATGRHMRRLPLWRALRDVVLFWVEHGVRIFRVDNPHTKPLPFWQWMIAEVHARHPDVIFLSEAFTRPKMMYRLAKIGFTQSYTYFTWRNDKEELDDYLRELSAPPAADFFRPNFFVNTPDINPVFLQTSGRPGFLIRAALAAAGSGLWGLYSGFELCESAALPGKEEYLDAEKYELRQRDWHAPGNIRAEITRLNLIRRANPALQTHRGYTPTESGNGRVLAFYKATPGLGNVVLAAISLDPHGAQEAWIEAPLWLFGQPDTGELAAEDLLAETRETWRGKTRRVVLSPDQPYRLWRLSLGG